MNEETDTLEKNWNGNVKYKQHSFFFVFCFVFAMMKLLEIIFRVWFHRSCFSSSLSNVSHVLNLCSMKKSIAYNTCQITWHSMSLINAILLTISMSAINISSRITFFTFVLNNIWNNLAMCRFSIVVALSDVYVYVYWVNFRTNIYS